MTEVIAGVHGNIETPNIRRLLDLFFARLVTIYRDQVRSGVRAPYRPCASCGLKPSTWKREGDKGFEKTMHGLWQSIENGTPFVCHSALARTSDGGWEPPERPEDAIPCASWLVVECATGAESAMLDAAIECAR